MDERLAQFVVNSHIRHHPLMASQRAEAKAKQAEEAEPMDQDTPSENPTPTPTPTPTSTKSRRTNLRDEVPIHLPTSTDEAADEVSSIF